jgi:hypothetical protein
MFEDVHPEEESAQDRMFEDVDSEYHSEENSEDHSEDFMDSNPRKQRSEDLRRDLENDLEKTKKLLHENSGNDRAQRIPKVVHHIYKEDLSQANRDLWLNKIWYQSYLAWKTQFPEPEYQHIFWSDDKGDGFFKANCSKHWDMYQGLSVEIEKADVLRYCLLWQLGGIYADLDYEPLQNFYHRLKPGEVHLVQSPYPHESVQNSLMASPKAHPFWDDLMAHVALQASKFQKRNNSIGTLQRERSYYLMDAEKVTGEDVLATSGPRVLSSFIENLPPSSSTFHILPCDEFQPIIHGKEALDPSEDKQCPKLNVDDVKHKITQGIHWGTSIWSQGSRNTHLVFKAFHMAMRAQDLQGLLRPSHRPDDIDFDGELEMAIDEYQFPVYY